MNDTTLLESGSHRICPSPARGRIGPNAVSAPLLAAFLCVTAGVLGGCGDDLEPAITQLSYEAIPGSGVALDQGTIDTTESSYADRDQFTLDVFDVLVPEIMAVVGIDINDTDSLLAPGGFLLETNPSMQSRIRNTLAPDIPERAEDLAAAFGYVFFQWSVLVTSSGSEASNGVDTAYGTVQFTDTALTPELAQAFFLHASSLDEGLNGGYSSFGNEMLFLNLRDPTGNPYSDLSDEVFLDFLQQATQSFADTPVTLVETGQVLAGLIENDWGTYGDGSQYLDGFTDTQKSALDKLQDRFETSIGFAAARYDWQVGPPEETSAALISARRGARQALERARATRLAASRE